MTQICQCNLRSLHSISLPFIFKCVGESKLSALTPPTYCIAAPESHECNHYKYRWGGGPFGRSPEKGEENQFVTLAPKHD